MYIYGKFTSMAKLKKTNNGKSGGLLFGSSHAQGGIKAIVTDTNQPVELESQEAIIKKSAVLDPTVKTLTGTNQQILSKINQDAGGNPIVKPIEGKAEDGGMIVDHNLQDEEIFFESVSRGGDEVKKTMSSYLLQADKYAVGLMGDDLFNELKHKYVNPQQQALEQSRELLIDYIGKHSFDQFWDALKIGRFGNFPIDYKNVIQLVGLTPNADELNKKRSKTFYTNYKVLANANAKKLKEEVNFLKAQENVNNIEKLALEQSAKMDENIAKAAAENFIKENPTKMYNDIKSCLLEEGDEEGNFIFEGKEFLHKGDKWKFVSFFKYGAKVEHIIKNKLEQQREPIELTFDEIKQMYGSNDIEIFGIDSIHKLNHCFKLLKKCIDLIDEKQAHKETVEKISIVPPTPTDIQPIVDIQRQEAIDALTELLEIDTENAEWKQALYDLHYGIMYKELMDSHKIIEEFNKKHNSWIKENAPKYGIKYELGGAITTHVQWESAILETVGNNHYLRMNGESWKLTAEQLAELLKELESFNNPMTAAKFIYEKDKLGYEKVTRDLTDEEIFESQFGK